MRLECDCIFEYALVTFKIRKLISEHPALMSLVTFFTGRNEKVTFNYTPQQVVERFWCDVTYTYLLLVLGQRTVEHRVENGTSRDQHVTVGGDEVPRAVWRADDELYIALDLVIEHVAVTGEHAAAVLPVFWLHLQRHFCNTDADMIAV